MNITVIIGTDIKGCTYHIKEAFLESLRGNNTITEFSLPKDAPLYCTGCKNCFFNGEEKCPHADKVSPIWESMITADLIVFTYPVYVLRAPGQVKSLLDHFGVHWMVHRPDERIFHKRAVILTNSVGAPNGSAQKDVKTSLQWLGISSIKTLGFGLMEDVRWDKISTERKDKIIAKAKAFAEKVALPKKPARSIKHHVIFAICRIMHQKALKKENPPSLDNHYWLDKGWIKKR